MITVNEQKGEEIIIQNYPVTQTLFKFMYFPKSKTAAACLNLCANSSGAANDSFFLNALKTLFRLSRVFLDL